MHSPIPDGHPAIQVDALAYTYPGRTHPAVDSVSFHVDAGETLGFLGPSGAGKSTTQRALIGLLAGFQGAIRVLGRPLGEWGSDLYRQIGVSFELPSHYKKLTAVENLRLFADLHGGGHRSPLELLHLVGLGADAETRAGEFSKGMAMRLNLARALQHSPAVLFLDEPTSGMDPANARLVRELVLAERARGRAIFLTTHDMSVADAVCDRVALMVDGRLVAIDTPRALKLAHGRATVKVEYRGVHGLDVAEFAVADMAQDPGFLALVRSGAIETVHSQEATLETAFLALTGRTLT